MKNRLCYQTSEYDCGPTTLLNAMRYLFEREDILPEILKTIFLYSLDCYNEKGECGKSGTSYMAMMYLSYWFNHFNQVRNFPIYTEFLQNEKVWIGESSEIAECLRQGGAVILLVWLDDGKHYVLLTDIDEEYIYLFDSYDWEEPINGTSIQIIEDNPKKMNRKVKIDVINNENEDFYNMGSKQGREAMLLYNISTGKIPKNCIS